MIVMVNIPILTVMTRNNNISKYNNDIVNGPVGDDNDNKRFDRNLSNP